MLFSDIPFAKLRALLLDLGFVEKAVPQSAEIGVPGPQLVPPVQMTPT